MAHWFADGDDRHIGSNIIISAGRIVVFNEKDRFLFVDISKISIFLIIVEILTAHCQIKV